MYLFSGSRSYSSIGVSRGCLVGFLYLEHYDWMLLGRKLIYAVYHILDNSILRCVSFFREGTKLSGGKEAAIERKKSGGKVRMGIIERIKAFEPGLLAIQNCKERSKFLTWEKKTKKISIQEADGRQNAVKDFFEREIGYNGCGLNVHDIKNHGNLPVDYYQVKHGLGKPLHCLHDSILNAPLPGRFFHFTLSIIY